MQLIPVESSNIKAIGYETDGFDNNGHAFTNRLVIQFSHGKFYGFLDVPNDVYIEFLRSESKGKYFNANIRNKYRELLIGDKL